MEPLGYFLKCLGFPPCWAGPHSCSMCLVKSYSVPPLLTSVIYFGGLLEISKSMQSLSCRTLNTFLTSGKELPSIRNQIKPPSPSFTKR